MLKYSATNIVGSGSGSGTVNENSYNNASSRSVFDSLLVPEWEDTIGDSASSREVETVKSNSNFSSAETISVQFGVTAGSWVTTRSGTLKIQSNSNSETKIEFNKTQRQTNFVYAAEPTSGYDEKKEEYTYNANKNVRVSETYNYSDATGGYVIASGNHHAVASADEKETLTRDLDCDYDSEYVGPHTGKLDSELVTTGKFRSTLKGSVVNGEWVFTATEWTSEQTVKGREVNITERENEEGETIRGTTTEVTDYRRLNDWSGGKYELYYNCYVFTGPEDDPTRVYREFPYRDESGAGVQGLWDLGIRVSEARHWPTAGGGTEADSAATLDEGSPLAPRSAPATPNAKTGSDYTPPDEAEEVATPPPGGWPKPKKTGWWQGIKDYGSALWDTYSHESAGMQVYNRMREQGHGTGRSLYVGVGTELARATGVENLSYALSGTDPVTGEEYGVGRRAAYTVLGAAQTVGTAFGLKGLFGLGGKIVDKVTEIKSADGLHLFKWGKDQTKKGAWQEGDRMLFLPDKGGAKANWKQNSSRLREEMKQGKPIYDTHICPETGKQIETGGFLNAERKLLESKGWVYDPQSGAYLPPETVKIQ